MRKVALILVILAMTAPLALGKTLNVDADYAGSDSSYFTTMQGAWDAAADNDTINVFAGVYTCMNLNNVGKHGITVQAQATTDGKLYEKVILQRYNESNGVYVRGPDNMTFEGLIFRGQSRGGGTGSNYGMYVRSPWCDNLTFDHCIFTGADSYGLYMYHGGLNATIDHCSFIGNDTGLRLANSSTLANNKITNSLFYDCHSWRPDAWTSGVFTPAAWTGYAIRLNNLDDEFADDPLLQNCVIYASYGLGGPRTDGLNSISEEATIGTGNVVNITKPVILSINSAGEYFGYLSSNNYASILNGSDTGGYIGARPTLVPEPATISLLMLGLLGLRRRRK